jgi:hypothetical protein
MRRIFTLYLAVFLLCGCRNQSPPGSDPFYGRTTVPAPATGAAAMRPSSTLSQAAPGSAGPSVAIPQSQPTRTNTTAAPSPTNQTAASPLVGNSPSVIRIVEPSNSSKSATNTTSSISTNGVTQDRGENTAALARDDISPAASKNADATLAGRTSMVRTLSARPKPVDATSAKGMSANQTNSGTPTGMSFQRPARAIDIMDLPVVDSSTPSSTLRRSEL